MSDTTDRFVSPCPLPTPRERELLVILMEECAEVQQRAAKLIRFGRDEVQPGQPLSNAERLADEYGDMLALLDACVAAGLVPLSRVDASCQGKVAKLARFLQTEGGDQ